MAWRGMALHGMTWHSMALHDMTWRGTAWHGMTWLAPAPARLVAHPRPALSVSIAQPPKDVFLNVNAKSLGKGMQGTNSYATALARDESQRATPPRGDDLIRQVDVFEHKVDVSEHSRFATTLAREHRSRP